VRVVEDTEPYQSPTLSEDEVAWALPAVALVAGLLLRYGPPPPELTITMTATTATIIRTTVKATIVG
jgi:hypothetical protein